MFGLKPSDLKVIVKILRQHPEVEEAVVFGSRAMGNYKPGSDVDIALKGQISSDAVIDISAELNEQIPLPYKFDVVAYSSITHKPLIEHIDRHGKQFYKRTKNDS